MAARHRIAAERIVLGNGSNDALELAARAVLAPSCEAIMSAHGFIVFHYCDDLIAIFIVAASEQHRTQPNWPMAITPH